MDKPTNLVNVVEDVLRRVLEGVDQLGEKGNQKVDVVAQGGNWRVHERGKWSTASRSSSSSTFLVPSLHLELQLRPFRLHRTVNEAVHKGGPVEDVLEGAFLLQKKMFLIKCANRLLLKLIKFLIKCILIIYFFQIFIFLIIFFLH